MPPDCASRACRCLNLSHSSGKTRLRLLWLLFLCGFHLGGRLADFFLRVGIEEPERRVVMRVAVGFSRPLQRDGNLAWEPERRSYLLELDGVVGDFSGLPLQADLGLRRQEIGAQAYDLVGAGVNPCQALK